MAQMRIRRAEAGDMAAVERMQAEVFGGEQDIPPELLPLPAESGARWWCAVSPEDGLLGTAAAWTEGGETHWGRFAVRRDLRGHGLGTALARASLDEIFAGGTETVHAEAREATVRILCALGGRVTGGPVPFFRGTVTPVELRRADYIARSDAGGPPGFEKAELTEARRQIDSILHKLRAAADTLEARDPKRYRAQLTLARRRVRALELAVRLIEAELARLSGPETR